MQKKSCWFINNNFQSLSLFSEWVVGVIPKTTAKSTITTLIASLTSFITVTMIIFDCKCYINNNIDNSNNIGNNTISYFFACHNVTATTAFTKTILTTTTTTKLSMIIFVCRTNCRPSARTKRRKEQPGNVSVDNVWMRTGSPKSQVSTL